MALPNKFSPLQPMSKALSAPTHSEERISLNVIAESLKFIEEAKVQRERAELLPHNQVKARNDIQPTSLIDASVLKTLGKGGSLVDEKG